MAKKNKKQSTVIQYPVDITVDPTAENEDIQPETPDTPPVEPVTESPTENHEPGQDITTADQPTETPASESADAAPEEAPVEESQAEADESPAEDPADEAQDAENPDQPVDEPKAESTGDVYRNNWQASIAEIEQQPRMKRGFTERAIRLYPRQVAIVEDVAVFRRATPNKVIQRALNDGVDHRYALIASSILSDPLLKDTISPADIDAVMFAFMDGQISQLRAKAQETVNPAERASEWQRVDAMEQIRNHFKRHVAWAE